MLRLLPFTAAEIRLPINPMPFHRQPRPPRVGHHAPSPFRRLTQRLIELKKDNWTAPMYPVEPHAFRQPSSWRDEYQRILDLFERELAANE